jgi:hypothetical protein
MSAWSDGGNRSPGNASQDGQDAPISAHVVTATR